MKILKKILKPFTQFVKRQKHKREIRRKLNKEPGYSSFKELEKIDGDLKKFEKFINKSGKIGIILGAKGSGKSALGMRILENIYTKNRKVQALGFDKNEIPNWLEAIKSIEEIRNGSFLLADEAGISFSSRSSMSSINKLLSKLLLISRHKNMSMLFITQNSANLEVNTLRQADYLLLKPSSLLQLDFERKKIKEIYQEVKDKFEKYDGKEVTYIYSDDYRGFVKNKLPSFWSEDLSKSFETTQDL